MDDTTAPAPATACGQADVDRAILAVAQEQDVESILDDVVVLRLPLTVRFRGVTTREAVLVRGPRGWGEFAPFTEYDDAEAVTWWRACLEAAWLGFPPAVRTEIPVNATVPAVPADRVPAMLRGYGDGISAVKVKVAEYGQGLDDDDARVAAVRAALPDAKIRVDANQGWTVPQALAALRCLSRHELEYAEQPVPGLDGLYAVREALANGEVPVRIAADESVRKASDPLEVARAGAADLIVVKVAPLGGVRRVLDLVARAGLPAVVSSALDTSVGLRAGVALAAALPELPYACGLGTGALLDRDVLRDPVTPRGGKLRVGGGDAVSRGPVNTLGGGALDAPGPDGVLVDGELRVDAELLVGPERRRWWEDRVRRVHGLLQRMADSTGAQRP